MLKHKDKNNKSNDTETNQMFKEISDVEAVENEVGVKNKELIDKMVEKGIYFGRKKSYWHPKMKPYILGVKNGICIIDLTIIASKLKEAAKFMAQILKEGIILFVDTKINQNDLIKKLAEEFKCPYVSERWLGGTLTNFKVISKRIKYFIDFSEKMAAGEFDKYTKHERIKMNKELETLNKKFSSLKNLDKLPAALFIVDPRKEINAVREAKIMRIPIIGLCNTDADPTDIDYVIPCNNNSRASIEILFDYIIKEIKSTE